MTCLIRCKQARHKICKCSCKGKNHGTERKIIIIETMLTRYLNMNNPSYFDYKKGADMADKYFEKFEKVIK